MSYMHAREYPRFYPVYHKLSPLGPVPVHHGKFRVTPTGLGTFRIGEGSTLGSLAILGGASLLVYWLYVKATETSGEDFTTNDTACTLQGPVHCSRRL